MITGPKTHGKYHKHGYSHTRIDNIYKTMIDRCCNPHNRKYATYGAKGIKVCDEWKNDKLAFFEWAFSHGYRDDLTIDRLDGDKGYAPDNCRWANYVEQNNHRKNNHFVTVDGVSHTIAEWARISGIKQGTIQYRISRGWNAKDAIFGSLIPPEVSGRMATKGESIWQIM